jgi:hypothetical protein
MKSGSRWTSSEVIYGNEEHVYTPKAVTRPLHERDEQLQAQSKRVTFDQVALARTMDPA